MSVSTPTILRAAALLAAVALVSPASADVLLQTATADPAAPALGNVLVLQGDGTTAGNGFAGGSFFIGADFTVTGPTQVSSIGANFINTANEASSGPSGDGTIFGAIVQVDPVSGLPTQPVESLASITLGFAVFTPTADGDTAAALSLVLQPGTYGLVFGSGLFGATGIADLLLGNDTVGTPSIFENAFAPFATDPFDTDVRLFALGTPVPEPAAIALLSVGALVTGLARRRCGTMRGKRGA